MKKTILRIFSMVMIVVILSAFTVTSFAAEIRHTRSIGDESECSTFTVWTCGEKYDNSAYYWWGGAGARLEIYYPEDSEPADPWFESLDVTIEMTGYDWGWSPHTFTYYDILEFGESTFYTEEFSSGDMVDYVTSSVTALITNQNYVYVAGLETYID